ncbi:MAG: ubiquinol-cytochrome c reductase iron-sulfur subunit, partial [Actinomycetota bacterium]|nr:ubiquinol-cytochrome c reductase iron-sulfur subunit [Actinomycetota bacterium]
MSSPGVPGGDPRRERRDVFFISTAFAISVVAALGLGVLYWQGGQPQIEGTLLAVSAGGIAVGLIMWSHRLMPSDREFEARDVLASSQKERAALDADLDRGQVLSRRRVLRRFLFAAVGAMGVAFLFPLRSLGPRPSDRELDASPWKAGTRLVTE